MIKDELNIDENENYILKPNMNSMPDLLRFNFEPAFDMEMEQHIIAEDIFSLPEGNWEHLGTKSIKYIKFFL